MKNKVPFYGLHRQDIARHRLNGDRVDSDLFSVYVYTLWAHCGRLCGL